ncbi:hypothetical protein BGX28_003469 [Mortierella sp. GBA30]|nr:hypothetical protein BGX28_003469 [Mortierella sp. GBA30]
MQINDHDIYSPEEIDDIEQIGYISTGTVAELAEEFDPRIHSSPESSVSPAPRRGRRHRSEDPLKDKVESVDVIELIESYIGTDEDDNEAKIEIVVISDDSSSANSASSPGVRRNSFNNISSTNMSLSKSTSGRGIFEKGDNGHHDMPHNTRERSGKEVRGRKRLWVDETPLSNGSRPYDDDADPSRSRGNCTKRHCSNKSKYNNNENNDCSDFNASFNGYCRKSFSSPNYHNGRASRYGRRSSQRCRRPKGKSISRHLRHRLQQQPKDDDNSALQGEVEDLRTMIDAAAVASASDNDDESNNNYLQTQSAEALLADDIASFPSLSHLTAGFVEFGNSSSRQLRLDYKGQFPTKMLLQLALSELNSLMAKFEQEQEARRQATEKIIRLEERMREMDEELRVKTQAYDYIQRRWRYFQIESESQTVSSSSNRSSSRHSHNSGYNGRYNGGWYDSCRPRTQ